MHEGRLQRATDMGVIGLFLVAICLPLIGQLSGVSRPISESTENRRAASFPQLEWREHGGIRMPRKASLLAFPESYERYFNDHFGFRRELVRCYNLARWHGLTPNVLASPTVTSSKLPASVVVGRGGWLYLNQGHSLETYRCAHPFTEEQLHTLATVMRQRREWLARRGIHFLLVIAPAKPSIYPEFLPRAVQRIGDRSRLDQWIAYLPTEEREMVLDPRDPLRQAKSLHPTYHRTDTHWNHFGALIAYQQLMQRLSRQFPQTAARTLADFDIRLREGPGLDLAKMLDNPFPIKDEHVELIPKFTTAAHMQPPLELLAAGSSADSANPQATLPKAVVLHDSFFLNLMPLFNEDWRQVHYEWTYDFPCDVIEREQPQVVIMELAERGLIYYTNNNNPAEVIREAQLIEAAVPDRSRLR